MPALDAMDLRFVGSVKALALLALLALLFTRRARARPAWMIVHAAVFAIVLADPVVSLWMNTLYTEFSAVLFGYAAIGCIAVMAGLAPARIGAGRSRSQSRSSVWTVATAACAAAAPPRVIGGTADLAGRTGQRGVLLFVSIFVLAMQTVVFVRPDTIRAANSVNVVLGALLPTARGTRTARLPRSGCRDSAAMSSAQRGTSRWARSWMIDVRK